MIRVLIVDDHAVVRAGLSALIATTPDLGVVGEAANGAEALERARVLQPDVIVMDLSMPGPDANHTIARLLGENPAAHVLVLTSFGDRERVVAALEVGARGFLLKHTDPQTLLDGIRQIATGGSPLDPLAARVLLGAVGTPRRDAPLRDAPLTDREREVLALVGEGQPNRTIARQLGISERTVKAHLTSIYRRLGVTDRTRAALWVQRQLRTE